MMWAGWEHIPLTLTSIQPIRIYSISAPLSPQPPPRIYKYNNITKCLQITYIIEIIFDSEGCFMCLLKFNSLKMLFQARIYYYIFYCVRICNSFFFLFFSSIYLHFSFLSCTYRYNLYVFMFVSIQFLCFMGTALEWLGRERGCYGDWVGYRFECLIQHLLMPHWLLLSKFIHKWYSDCLMLLMLRMWNPCVSRMWVRRIEIRMEEWYLSELYVKLFNRIIQIISV